ncbi:MAG TPA: tripartite tricarboxylate transporter TctB family protein [Ramlibacter sp.]|jgi:putative tricarboxylic transport membrane protein
MDAPAPRLQQTLIGAGVLVLAALLAAGAVAIPAEAGYGGVGPNFLPWLIAAVLALCGGWLLWEARTGGYRQAEPASGAERGDWRGFAWVSAGLLANALLITHAGFIISCTLCFVLAARGLRVSEDQPATVGTLGRDALVGLAIAAPVYWAFTKLLGINLPGLTATGWI